MNTNSPGELNKRVFGVENPVALVTGSGSARVGRCIAETLRAAGFRIVLHANRSADEARQVVQGWNSANVQAASPVASLIIGDVSDEALVAQWRSQVAAEFGRLDVLVNSAAIWEPTRLEELKASDFEHFFRINALGTALMNQHFGLWMTEQESGGAIINIGDWATARPYRDFAAYFPSKAAVVSITQSMAVELASRNPKVRVNAVLPGPVLIADEVSAERQQRIIDECLLKRAGSPEDVSQAVMFLATSPFITGVAIPVDGGRSIFAGASADPIAHPRVN